MGGSRTQVSRPVHLETGAPESALRTATIKAEAEKKRLTKVAPCALLIYQATKPDR